MSRFRLTECFLLVVLLACKGMAQEHMGAPPPFPLPTRAMRLIEDAKDPKTPSTQLLELVTPQSTQLREAALQSLVERGDASVLPPLEKVQGLAPLDAEITEAIRKIRVRLGLEKVAMTQNDRDAVIAELQLHPIWEWKEDDWDNDSVRGYVQRLLELTQSGDKRILPFVEEYALKVRPHLTELENPLANDLELSQRDARLAEAYWKLRLGEMTLAQKVTLFKGSEFAQNQFLYYGLDWALKDVGSPLLPSMADIVRDKTALPNLRRRAAEILYWIGDPKTANVFLKALQERTVPEHLKETMLRFLALSGHPRSIQATIRVLEQNANEFPESWEEVGPALSRAVLLGKAQVRNKMLEKSLLPYIQKGSLGALEAVKEIGTEHSINVLLELAKNPRTDSQLSLEQIRRSTLLALGIIGQRIEDRDGQLQTFLLKMYYDKDFPARLSALAAFAQMGKPQAIPELLDLAQQEKDSRALALEVSGIYVAGGREAVAALHTIKQLAEAQKNMAIAELAEEGLMRLEREKRAGSTT